MESGLGPVENGELAPATRLLSIGFGREIELRERGGVPLVLVFHLQGTASAAESMNRAVRGRYTSGEVTVASVVDLSLVPTLYWGTVWIVLRQAYEKTAAELPPSVDPEEYVMLLPDWDGRSTRSFGLRDTGRVAVAMIDGDGWVSGVHQGEGLAELVLEWLEGED